MKSSLVGKDGVSLPEHIYIFPTPSILEVFILVSFA